MSSNGARPGVVITRYSVLRYVVKAIIGHHSTEDPPHNAYLSKVMMRVIAIHGSQWTSMHKRR